MKSNISQLFFFNYKGGIRQGIEIIIQIIHFSFVKYSTIPIILHEILISTTVIVVVQLLSHAQLSATPWTAACQAPLCFTDSWSLLKFMSIESVTLSNHLIRCHPLLLCLQTFTISESLLMSLLFIPGGQNIHLRNYNSSLQEEGSNPPTRYLAESETEGIEQYTKPKMYSMKPVSNVSFLNYY